MADIFDGIVIGAAAAAIGTIVAFKFLNRQPQGGALPQQPASMSPTNKYMVQSPMYTDGLAAPIGQNTPITEAAFNIYPVEFAPGFGPKVNRDSDEALLPV